MRSSALVCLGLLASAALLAAPRDARACGGAFEESPLPGQPPEVITVASQRIVFAASPAQTVLWSQIRYEGNPTGFAWVLPVGPGATLEESTDAWFEALDAFSATRVLAPPVVCSSEGSGSSSSGCGCGEGDGALAGNDRGNTFGGVPPEEVSVVHEGSVGPYETVTLDTSSGQALQQWLVDHGYEVPPDVVPVLDAYAAEGLDFIALRLKAGAGVDQMTPVRVTAPGGSPIVPMRMMAAGAGDTVPVTLFVLGEGRYASGNYPMVALDPERLTWDFQAEQSNYAALRDEAFASQAGRAFLPTFALGNAFAQDVLYRGAPIEITVERPSAERRVTKLSDLYFAQAAVNAGMAPDGCTVSDDVAQFADELVVAACSDGTTDGGECPDGDGVTASVFACDGFTDLAVALTGMHPGDVWLTRLEGDLPVGALTDDLVLEASVSQQAIPGWLEAADVTNVPCSDFYIEEETTAAAAARPTGLPRNSAAVMVVVAAAGALARRRRHPVKDPS